jgi:hypothetical protein
MDTEAFQIGKQAANIGIFPAMYPTLVESDRFILHQKGRLGGRGM